MEQKKLLVNYFSVFECVGHVRVPDARRSKLECKCVSYILLGVNSELKGYKMFDPISKKIIVSRNVVF